MLALDDPRWKNLNHGSWAKGAPYPPNSKAPFVPDELAHLLKNPHDLARFQLLWPYLSSEGTTWAAAYASVPYIVEIAANLSPKERSEYLIAIGFIVMNSCPEQGPSFVIEPYVAEDYRQALCKVMPLLAETMLCKHDAIETRYLLSAAAALKGHPKLGLIMEHLDCIGGECPQCGNFVYPDEVQRYLSSK